MAEPEKEEIIPPKKKRSHWLRYTLIGLFLFLLALFITAFYSFNYFGERILRKFLQEKVYTASDSLYRVDFRKMNLNIITGKLTLDSFELTPDSIRYRQLKSEGRINKALYHVSFESLIIDRIHFWQIYTQKRINFRQIVFQRPVLSIEGFPDTITALHARWRVIYEDIYPAVAKVFSDFHVDSVKVNRGLLLSSFRQKTGKLTSGEYEFSSVLRDVSVNPFSYYNRERIFYSKDVELKIHDFEYYLADSLYLLKADELGFSFTQSVLYGKNLSLKPVFHALRMKNAKAGDFFQVDLPDFTIRGINLFQALNDRKVEIKSIQLGDFSFKVFSNRLEPSKTNPAKSKKKLKIANLYTVIAKELLYIKIDSLSVKSASVEFYTHLRDHSPELSIRKVELDLFHFLLDSISNQDKSRIFHSENIELTLDDCSLLLRDGIHSVNALRIYFSTRKSLIDISESIIRPDKAKNIIRSSDQRNTMLFFLPRLTFTGIDLKRVFNERILDFNRLEIMEPDINYTRFHPSKNKDPRFKRPEDFFEEENEEIVYDLLKKYLRVIRGNEITISNGYMQYATDQEGVEKTVASGSFNLSMHRFLIDSVQGMNQQGYFYSQDFDLDFHTVAFESPDSLRHFRADRIHIATVDSLIEAYNLTFSKTSDPDPNSDPGKKLQSLSIGFSLKKLMITGLNHKKLFLEKRLKADVILLEDPELHAKAEVDEQPWYGPAEPLEQKVTRDFMHEFEINRLLVRHGSFSYDGYEDRRASFFSLKDIDFSILNAHVHIPDKGMNNGLIRFDSMQISVFPFRAVVADSSYMLECQNLEINSYPANISAKGLKLIPLRTRELDQKHRPLFLAEIPEIKLMGFYFDKAIFEKKWILDRIEVKNPYISIVINPDTSSPSPLLLKEKGAGVEVKIHLPPMMKKLEIASGSILNARTELKITKKNGTKSWSLDGINLDITRFLVDSLTQANPGKTPLFNADDVTISSRGISRISDDSMYNWSFAGFGFSTFKKSIFIDSVSMIPRYSRMDFSRKLGYQSDQLQVKIPHIMIERCDFRKLLSELSFHAGRIEAQGMIIEDYRDKRVPFPEWQRPPMPAQAIRKIKFPVLIDTIAVTDSYASYEEQTGDEPGRIFFDRMNAIVTGFNTDSTFRKTKPDLEINFTGYLMGKTLLEASIRTPLGNKKDTLFFKAKLDELQLTEINPLVSKLLPVTILEGVAPKTEITFMNANQDYSTGEMKLFYKDVKIRLENTKTGWQEKWEKSIIGFAANNILDFKSNPNYNGNFRTGIIWFERDKRKGVINFLWKSSLSGIKSSFGLNSKQQKEWEKMQKQDAKK